jgi:hypothetical protein
VDGGAVQRITGSVLGPAARMVVSVRQARAVLVPVPTR